MEIRLERYGRFVSKEYFAGFLKPDEYAIDDVKPELRLRIQSGAFERIVFTGMACSAMVSDIIPRLLLTSGGQ